MKYLASLPILLITLNSSLKSPSIKIVEKSMYLISDTLPKPAGESLPYYAQDRIFSERETDSLIALAVKETIQYLSVKGYIITSKKIN